MEVGTQRWSPNPGSQISVPHPLPIPFVFVLSQMLNPREDRKAFSLGGLTRGILGALCASWAENGKVGALGEGEATDEGRNHLKAKEEKFCCRFTTGMCSGHGDV